MDKFTYRPLKDTGSVDINGIKLAIFEQMDGQTVVGYAVAPLNAFAAHGEQHDGSRGLSESGSGTAVATSADSGGDLNTETLDRARRYLGILEMSLKMEKIFAHGVVGEEGKNAVPTVQIDITQGDDGPNILTSIKKQLQLLAEYLPEDPPQYDIALRSVKKEDVFSAVSRAIDDYAPAVKDNEKARRALTAIGMQYVMREGQYAGVSFGSGMDFRVMDDATAHLSWQDAMELAGAFQAISEKAQELGGTKSRVAGR